MKRCYYFVAKYVKNGITRTCTGTQETIDGYFDFALTLRQTPTCQAARDSASA